MDRSLKSRTLRGLFWSFLELAAQQGIQFAVTVILARLLFPEEFGLIAMLAIFMAIGQTLINSGFGQALIQKEDVTHIDECSIFYFNIIVGCLGAGLLWLAAPWIAAFYEQPLLIKLTRAMSPILVINAFGLVQTALLSKKLDFKTQSKVSLIATLAAGTIGIAMAYRGYGVWSLVAYALSTSLFRSLLLWLFHHWRPAWAFSFASLRTMFGFSSKLLCSCLLEAVFQNVYLLVIGRLFSATALGFYYQANRTQQLPVSGISRVVGRVVFPVFSSIRDDKARLKRGVCKALTVLMMFNIPMMVGLAVVAKPLILLVFKEQWLPCLPYFQLLCVVGVLYPLHAINVNVLIAIGRPDLLLRVEVLKKVLVLVAIVATCRWGIVAIIYGQIDRLRIKGTGGRRCALLRRDRHNGNCGLLH